MVENKGKAARFGKRVIDAAVLLEQFFESRVHLCVVKTGGRVVFVAMVVQSVKRIKGFIRAMVFVFNIISVFFTDIAHRCHPFAGIVP